LQLYSDAAEYGATLTGVTFSKITPSEATALRMSARFVSAPIFVTLPKLDFLTAARAVLAGSAVQTAKSCSPRFGYTDFYLRQLVPGYDASANWVAWRQQRADAFAHSPTVTAAALVSDSPPSCDRPNAVVGVAQLVQPTYPRLAREQGISGTAVIKVDVDESGSVTSATIFQSAGDTSLDIAALNSARQSKYSPETFRCLSIPATYLFPMTFGKPQNNTDKKQY
jgi:protein TonB